MTAYSNNSNYANGEALETFIAWTGVEAIQPRVTATEPENGGIKVSLENYEDYNAGITLTVSIYADKTCTTLLKQQDMTYTTSEFFGNITHNCNVSLEVKDAADAAEDDLVVGMEYYAVMAFDPDIYTGTTAGDGTEASSSGGGSMGGPGF